MAIYVMLINVKAAMAGRNSEEERRARKKAWWGSGGLSMKGSALCTASVQQRKGCRLFYLSKAGINGGKSGTPGSRAGDVSSRQTGRAEGRVGWAGDMYGRFTQYQLTVETLYRPWYAVLPLSLCCRRETAKACGDDCCGMCVALKQTARLQTMQEARMP